MIMTHETECPQKHHPLRNHLISTMDSTPTLLRRPPFPSPPPPPQPAHSFISDSSPFLPILYLFAFIGIIGLIYAIFFSIKWNTRLRRSSSGVVGGSTHLSINTSDSDKLVSSVVYEKEAHGGGDCPVCLTAFMDGESIREVNVCKHLFHGGCIDTWLCSHSNCPVCRAFIGTRQPKLAVVMGGEDDLRRGSPDSATLV